MFFNIFHDVYPDTIYLARKFLADVVMVYRVESLWKDRTYDGTVLCIHVSGYHQYLLSSIGMLKK